jgi:hypothetical protein
MKLLTFTLLAWSTIFNSACATTGRLDLEIEAKDSASKEAKKVLEDLLGKYDLAPYIHTKKVRIESDVIPHSHPVLTLKAEEKKAPDSFLGTFIHEQMHWYWIKSSPGIDIGPRIDFKEKYPHAPIKLPQGARGPSSTYQHLGICWLEYKGLIHYIGKERAKDVLLNKPYYTWVYKTVVEDFDWIGSVMGKYNMAGPHR